MEDSVVEAAVVGRFTSHEASLLASSRRSCEGHTRLKHVARAAT